MTNKQPTNEPPAEAGDDAPSIFDSLLKVEHGEDGTPLPLSLMEQWQQVERWHRVLEDERVDDYPVLASFNVAWDELNSLYEYNGESVIERGGDLRRVSGSPFSTLFYFVDMGFYPPPELLLSLQDAWNRYIAAMGVMSLEEAFFGQTKKGLGNYAARKRSALRKMRMRLEFDRMLRAGMARTEIAEEMSNRMGGKPDADSILRSMRGFNGFSAKRADSDEEK